jgi:serine/threonine protein phosphatase PrpC
MIRTYSFSAAGGHPINEDAFVVRALWRDPDCWLACVADGQGGRSGGAAAAQLACRTVSELVGSSAGPSWDEIGRRADAAVEADPTAGFTTLVALTVDESGGRRVVSGVSCGDSAAVVVCDERVPRVLTAHQFKDPPVGAGDALFIPFERELTAPWRVLLMSDGVWKYASWDRVWDCAVRLSGEELIAELQAAARLTTTGTFPDDFTVVLLEGE